MTVNPTEQKKVMNLICSGEGITLEFKKCKNSLNKDVYETVCAFLNRNGGTLLLGVNDSKEITGVDKDKIEQLRKDFVNAINNPQKINPTCYLSIEEILLRSKSILRIYVPESSQVHRCNGRIYDRNEDGDFDITDNTQLVAELYHRKQTSYSENKIYPYAGLHDLRADVIDKCRKLSQIFRKDHVWLTMDDMDLLRSAQLFKRDHETGKEGVTLAGILLLGRDDVILSVVPHHRTDLILRKVNIDRYDDRDFVDTNLVESYERIMAFIAKHLPDPFYLEKDMRKSIRDAIFREVASNIIIHREYLSAFPAKLIIERGIVRTENSNKPHGFGYIDPATFTPFPKNPNIARFFRQISRADELGSGVRNLMQYGKIYSGKNPILEENDIFRTTIYYPDFETTQKSEKKIFQNQVGAQNNNHSQAQQESQQESLRNRVLMLLINKELSKSEISRNLGHKKISGQLHPVIKSLLADGEIEYTIPEKPKSRMQKYRLTGLKKHTINPS